MKVFVFMEYRVDGNFNLGMLTDDAKLSELKIVRDAPAAQVREIINSIPTECIFVGKSLRLEILRPLLHQLVKEDLDLPEKLKFHWTPPFKLPFDDVEWLYNFGVFSEGFISLYEIGKNLDIEIDLYREHNIDKLAEIYFKLIGDFNRF